MKKIKIKHTKNIYRSSSSFNWTNPTKLNINNKNINKNFHHSSTTCNSIYNNNLLQNKNETISSLIKDFQIYIKQEEKPYKVNIKDIDIIKEKENKELLNKVSNYLDQKKEKISTFNKIKDVKLDNLKKLIKESKSEQNIFSKTFSTKFVENEEYNTLSKCYGKGHSKKVGQEFKKNDDKYEDVYFLKSKSELFSKYRISPAMTGKEKEILKSISKRNKKNIGINSKVKYYQNQFDSFKSLQINQNLYNQLNLKQEKEQIKQFLKSELENEQQRLLS